MALLKGFDPFIPSLWEFSESVVGTGRRLSRSDRCLQIDTEDFSEEHKN